MRLPDYSKRQAGMDLRRDERMIAPVETVLWWVEVAGKKHQTAAPIWFADQGEVGHPCWA